MLFAEATTSKRTFAGTTPIASEILDSHRLEELAEELARSASTTEEGRHGREVMSRVRANGRALLAAYRSTARAVVEQRVILPAAEWLIDNFHIVEEQLREITDDLPSGFYRGLPKLANEPLRGYPRVLSIIWAYIEHTESLYEADSLRCFIKAYQRIQPLTIGELWALPVWLRLLLVENLRRLADLIVHTRVERERADNVADSILGIGNQQSRRKKDILSELGDDPISEPFAVELIQRLRDRESSPNPALRMLDERLLSRGTSRDEIVAREHQRQAATHVMVRNIIMSMRAISSEDWQAFFEDVSLVDEKLRDGTRFSDSDFATRDRCRGSIEELARGSRWTEIEVAQLVAQLAMHASNEEARHADPAYYLIAEGRKLIEHEIGFRPRLLSRLRRAYAAQTTLVYLGSIFVITSAIVSVPILAAAWAGASPFAIAILVTCGLLPASDLAVAIVSASASDIVGARHLPRLSLPQGITTELRTLVVIPALIANESDVRELLENLEVHYLANRDGDVYFALATDWADAETESTPRDEPLLAQATSGIAELNSRYGTRRFFLFHRRRRLNVADQTYMGWERKRGKLHELNRLLRGATDTSFVTLDGHTPTYPDGVKYVISLDADTQMPQRAAMRLVGTAAHPLNRPVYDPVKGRVVKGHAILQPRITPCLPPSGQDTLFQRVYSGQQGTDPYAFVVFDVYQDLFGEGSYTGKGIYDVDAFELSLRGKFRDNTILSHDLIEGIFGRAGFVSDVELFEVFPPHYELAVRREHRWTRGDWQLLPWLFAFAKSSTMPAIGRWRILDNLRRSLSAPATVLSLLCGWFVGGHVAQTWTTFILATIALPRGFAVLSGIIPQRPNIAKRTHALALLTDIETAAWQTVLDVTFLAHKAYLAVDAIARTLVRLAITRRKLLEWVTAAQASVGVKLRLVTIATRMLPSVVTALVIASALLFLHFPDFWTWAPLTLLWACSPIVAWASSVPRSLPLDEPLQPEQRSLLERTAARTWRFFDSFVTDAENQLPPDNFQVDPRPVIAHRTSPTNIGLYFLSVVSAFDFGWITPERLTRRLQGTLSTLGKLERWQGHFYNWYDTEKLSALEPKYISTVDSGNLAGHLIAVAQSCHEYLHRPLLKSIRLTGITIWLDELRSALASTTPEHLDEFAHERIEHAIGEMRELGGSVPERVSELMRNVNRLSECAHELRALLHVPSLDDANPTDWRYWIDASCEIIDESSECCRQLFPWIGSFDQAEGRLREILQQLDIAPPSPAEAAAVYDDVLDALRTVSVLSERDGGQREEAIVACESAKKATVTFGERLADIYLQCERFTSDMNFSVLFDPKKRLFSIGYRLADGKLDTSYYDLLASEARLASYIAIAKGDVPASHWQKLGRPLAPAGYGTALLSWSGSMFEYLMPELVMREPRGSLLDQTAFLIVQKQIQYGRQRGVPWGISESAYNSRDASLNYQYSSFGVNGLGLKRGLSQNLVVAPYATALAAIVVPASAADNMRSLSALGAEGSYGFFEAIDFTRARLKDEQDYAVVRAYFAHHQGMLLVALSNVLLGETIRNRFHSDLNVRSADLLLQERTPRSVAVARPRADEMPTELRIKDIVAPALRVFQSPHNLTQRTHLLSNGRYTVMMTATGSGYSRYGQFAITRWREDPLRDCFGAFIYIKDATLNVTWSSGYRPSLVEPESYNVVFSEDRMEIQRQDRLIGTVTEVVVSPEDDAELRRISIYNKDLTEHEIEVTSFLELALATQAADESHPAFSSLFVETEYVEELETLLATRRQMPGQPTIWVAHLGAVQGDVVAPPEYETSRSNFVARGGTLQRPRAQDGQPLSGSTGTVLSPIFSLRYRIRIAAGATAYITYVTLAASSRESVLQIAQRYRVSAAFERTTTLAWTHAQVRLRHNDMDAEEAHVFQRLAAYLIFRQPRGESHTLAKDEQVGPSALWSHGISGDLPILVLRIDDEHDRDVVRQLLRAHQYWQGKNLGIDIVILNEMAASYDQSLENSINALIRAAQSSPTEDDDAARGRVFFLRADLLSPRVRRSILVNARVVIRAHGGSLSDYVTRRMRAEIAPRAPLRPPRLSLAKGGLVRPALEFDNGLGGFDRDGKEYVIALEDGGATPAPWINVIANEQFGFQVSESGAGYTWAENSHENQLTVWSNDAIIDPPSEVIYVRDDQNGEIWTPTPGPIRERSMYIVRHGFGYTTFEHESHEILLELAQFVATNDPVKVSRLTITNRSRRTRRLSVAAYAEWVLGASRAKNAPYILTNVDETGALFAQNLGYPEFAGRIAFADLGGAQLYWTCDRAEFLGLHGELERPSGLAPGVNLSNRSGGGLDACAALLTSFSLPPGGRIDVRFLLGQSMESVNARALVVKYRTANLDECLQRVRAQWGLTLEKIQVKTPDREFDILANGWLLYQTLACRMWARAAFYQAGGAYGFRDQLQDCMALVISRPDIARAHLLRAAARQFKEGDVQHWWHSPSGRGVRTRVSDDRVWLAFAVNHFVQSTGETTLWDQIVPFLEGPLLTEEQEDSYFSPAVSSEQGSIFEHCARAIDSSLKTGPHGLPLMGTGDWNDGMNRVGRQGTGESVWLAWFLCATLDPFIELARARGENERASRWQLARETLIERVESEAWDGDWYLRAFYDDGTPLGTRSTVECHIDSIAQSWAVLSRAAQRARAVLAMQAVERELVRENDRLILLLTPPFDKAARSPGYIAAYPPGIRENGGQYTHAAVWAIMALAAMGNGEKARAWARMINPILHAERSQIQVYSVEPYVLAADVYSAATAVGRGGWTWYTGSAGWFYRACVESILGLRLLGETLSLQPCIAPEWPHAEIVFKHRSSTYCVFIENPGGTSAGVERISLDGVLVNIDAPIALKDDGKTHELRVVLR